MQKSWEGHGPLNDADRARGEGPWPAVGPSALAVGAGWPVPTALSVADIKALVQAWGDAAARAARAGFEMLEVHGAHGYLIHQFLSPVSNVRTDAYGGSTAGRQRFALEVAEAVRLQWPAHLPLSWRMSLADLDEGLPFEELVDFVQALRRRGVDILDASSAAGISSYPSDAPRVPRGLEFRADDAQRIKAMTGIDIMAVGLIVDPQYAESLLASDQADLIAIGREALYNPNWAVHAQVALGANTDYSLWPLQYRAFLVKRAAVADPLRNAALQRDALRNIAYVSKASL